MRPQLRQHHQVRTALLAHQISHPFDAFGDGLNVAVGNLQDMDS
jgi:hypothetical protein